MCCHPEIPRDARVALSLKTVARFGVREIARAFLAEDAAIAQRLVRAKRQIRDHRLTLDVPRSPELARRLDSVAVMGQQQAVVVQVVDGQHGGHLFAPFPFHQGRTAGDELVAHVDFAHGRFGFPFTRQGLEPGISRWTNGGFGLRAGGLGCGGQRCDCDYKQVSFH